MQYFLLTSPDFLRASWGLVDLLGGAHVRIGDLADCHASWLQDLQHLLPVRGLRDGRDVENNPFRHFVCVFIELFSVWNSECRWQGSAVTIYIQLGPSGARPCFRQKNEDFDDVAVRDVSLGEARLQGLPLDLDWGGGWKMTQKALMSPCQEILGLKWCPAKIVIGLVHQTGRVWCWEINIKQQQEAGANYGDRRTWGKE